jgi:hypothetical protein
MPNKANHREDAPKRGKADKQGTSQQFETMSQKQNRQGKGRQQNGSDGTGKGRGSNH